MRLPRSFYARPAAEVAPDLLGKILARKLDGTVLRGRVVETEAYLGESDPGSHAFRGPTPRTQVMFGAPGFVYVYFTYGAHYCMNVVTDADGTAGAVLLRALEPLDGTVVMERNRGGRPLVDLCNGPGKLCQALGITREQNGTDLEGDAIWMEDDGASPLQIARSTRVGLSAGKAMPLRFYIPGSPYISRGRPSA
jgi:DNA-3-methyladenine glycosylase